MLHTGATFDRTTRPSVAVIGSGIAGLACAARLRDAGIDVDVFEKSRGVGGRMSTRRIESGVAFDHGAQYFTARHSEFATRVEQWRAQGVVAEWRGSISELRNGAWTAKRDGKRRFVGLPDMPAVCRSLGQDVPVRLNTRVARAALRRGRWGLTADTGEALGAFDVLLLALPPLQAAALLDDAPLLRDACVAAPMRGCWAVLAAFAAPLATPSDAAFVLDSPLSWIAHSSSKPGRSNLPDAWVLHAGHDWSDDHIEAAPEATAEQLLREFWLATGLAPCRPHYLAAHRWRYALPATPLPDRFLFDASLGVGVAGDWCGGPRVEGAFLSGIALADAARSAGGMT